MAATTFRSAVDESRLIPNELQLSAMPSLALHNATVSHQRQAAESEVIA